MVPFLSVHVGVDLMNRIYYVFVIGSGRIAPVALNYGSNMMTSVWGLFTNIVLLLGCFGNF